MTDDKIALSSFLETSSDANFLREMIGFAAERLMQLETGAICNAAPGERSADRRNQRNGYRDRDWETRAGTWQRCRVHFMRNALSYAGKTQKRVVSAWVGTAFAQDDAAAARQQWRDVADQMRPRVPKLAGLLDQAEADVLAHMDFPAQHRAKIHSTNPLERLNSEIKRPADVVGIFPNEAAVVRLIGALLLEQNDEWATQRARYMTLETIAPMSDTGLVSMPELAA
jgi:transposase-like protein